MTVIRGNAPVTAPLARLDDNSTQIPFAAVDEGNGLATRGNIEEALGRVFPQLTQGQAEALARDAFDSLPATSSGMDAGSWAKVLPSLMQSAAQIQSNNVNGTSGWLSATGIQPQVPLIGQQQIPLAPAILPGATYFPRNDFAVTGYQPYQYPLGMPAPMLNGRMPGMPGYETPIHQAATGAGRGILGFLKMMPGVGNVINGIDFVRDIGKGFSTWRDPTRTFGEKLKASADLLFHGAGMFVPQVGGAYDMAQGAVRTAEGMARMTGMGRGFMPYNMLPAFNYANAGIPNVYNMQNLNPAFSSPYMFNQFPNYSMYPSPMLQNPAFMPPWLGSQAMFRQPFPMYPYGANPGAMAAMTNPQFGTVTDGLKGAVREGVGIAKMAPGLGNLLNGVDFVMDIGHVISSLRGNPQHSFMKSAADLLFHGAGMLIPQVGGAYDMAQGAVRMGAAATMGPMRMLGMMPPYQFNAGGYPPVYNGGVIF